jgi:hypothetical protein
VRDQKSFGSFATETIRNGKQDFTEYVHSFSVSDVSQAIEAVLRAPDSVGSSRRKRVEKAEESAILFSEPRGNPRLEKQRLSETAGSGLASTACRCRRRFPRELVSAGMQAKPPLSMPSGKETMAVSSETVSERQFR